MKFYSNSPKKLELLKFVFIEIYILTHIYEYNKLNNNS